MHGNAHIARVLTEIGDINEIKGENAFKVRAYRNAAGAVEMALQDLSPLALGPDGVKRLQAIEGIGSSIAAKIVEIARTGTCEEHRALLAEFPPSLLEMLRLDGVGPKKVRLFFDALSVKSVDELEQACRDGRVRGLPKMGEKSESKILAAIAAHRLRTGRFLLPQAEEVVERMTAMLAALPGVGRVVPAGSFRRRVETVGDLDFLVTCEDPAAVSAKFAAAGEVLGSGGTKMSIRLSSGLQCDLRVVPDESFGAALLYFTGSKSHNIAIRGLALRQKLTVNEYGVHRLSEDGTAGARVAGKTEEECYAALGLRWVPPELREARGEVELAAAGPLPRLVEADDLRGDLHMHTTETDGNDSIEAMAKAAAARGLGYIAITDHSKALAFARGLDEARVAQHATAIRAVDRAMGGKVRVLAGIEVDILADGALDLAPETLRSLDVVVGSVHSRMDMGRDEMTARVVRAVESGLIDILGHPTGRIILRREPFSIDMEAVMRAAKARGVALEMNGNPDRRDMNDIHGRAARDMGVKITIDSDAHSTGNLGLSRYAVDSARRAGLTREDVLNTRECGDFLKALHAGHR